MFSFVCDKIRLDINNYAPNRFSGLNSQVKVNLTNISNHLFTSLLNIFKGFFTLIALGSIVPGFARLISLLLKLKII